MAEPINFEALVHRAADKVQREDKVTVTPEARRLLIHRAEEHAEEVYKVMTDRSLSVSDLEIAAAAQFREASSRHPALVRATITRAAVETAMERRCHFVPWC
jgi:hypothetical protein